MLRFRMRRNIENISERFLMIISSFSDIPPDVITFSITVLNKGKRAKDSEVAEVTIDLSSLPNGEEVSLRHT